MAMTITHLIFDLDGVLTDGKQYIASAGNKLFKAVHARDKLALKKLISQGYRITILTMDDWPGARIWFEGIGCEFFVTDRKEEFQIDISNSLGVGDDGEDWKWLSMCAYPFCVKDADPLLKELVNMLPVKGGAGVVNYIQNFLHDTYHRTSPGQQDNTTTIC